jgi:opacity protein-like surface antigen
VGTKVPLLRESSVRGAALRNIRNIGIAWLIAFVGLIAWLPSPSHAQGRIGNAAAVTNQVEGILGGSARSLAAGSDVHANELVRTQDASVAQLVFLDNTNLSVGPRSSVTLDRFVYDPDHGKGRVVVRATRGIFRFVTGSQPPQDYTIETPIATIGVRGTVFDFLVQPNRVIVILISGNVRVTARSGRTVWLTQPGTSVTVFAGGKITGPEIWNGTIIDTASNAPFPYFGGFPLASLPAAPPAFMTTSGFTPFLGIGGGFRSSSTDFDVTPPFDVSALTGVVDVNGGLLFNLPGSNLFFGPRVGGLFGFGSGSISDPPASPGFTYKVEMPWTVYYEAEFGAAFHGATMNDTRVHASVGGATVNTLVTATAGGFSVDSNVTRTGVTASLGIDVGVSPSLSVGGQVRYINVPSGPVDIPGTVPISSNVFIATVGLTWTASDIRLKRDILPLGRLDNGIRLYRFRYVWSDQVYVGAMAQEVGEIMPQAVMRGADGYLRVDYAQLGLRMMTWDEWMQSPTRATLAAN